MLLGVGNLMMVPLRVEYLADPTHGLSLSEAEVAVFLTTVPNLARLVGSMIWGRLFDAMNFFTLRAALNVCFMLAILSFFSSSTWVGLTLSAAIFGFSNSGGDVAWNLWVTKFAPADRVPDYMAVHTFFTGVRGLLAPACAYLLLEHYSLMTISWISIGLMGSSVVLLIPRARTHGSQ
jgi:predicted MFS family arabinose efflux permease